MKKVLGTMFIMAVIAVIWISQGTLEDVFAWFNDREAIVTSLQGIGIWGPVALFTLFVLQVFLAFIPGQALMVACGYLYGFWGGFLISWLSLVAGGEAAYGLARRYGRPFAEQWVTSSILTRWDKIADGQGIMFYVITLVMPFVPNDAMCYVAGLGRISHRRFSIANLLGRGLACAITSWVGAFGLQAPPHVWMIFVVLMFVILLIWQFARRLQQRGYFTF